MAKRLISYDGMKTATLWGGVEEGWVIQGGSDSVAESIPSYFRNVAWLYRAVQLVAGNVASMPFAIVKGETDIDTSQDWQNRLGYLPSPAKLFYLISASMSLTGKAYLWNEHNAAKSVKLRYLLPSSVTPVIDGRKGLTGFKRQVGGIQMDARLEDIVYFWLNDPMVEIGPPLAYPALAAMKAAGVLYNVDEFASQFFKKGAVKVTLFEAEGMGKNERDEFLNWWKRMTGGISKAWSTIITNSKNLKPVVIGEGIQELSNTTLTREEKEAIATALGIPFAILFSDAANEATAKQDWLNFLNNVIIPICAQIAETFNEQLLAKSGYKLVFRPETLDAFQEDESERATALGQIVTALTTPEEAEIAMKILGYELDNDTAALFQSLLAEKKKAREQAAEALAKQPEPVALAPGTPAQEDTEEQVAAEKSKWMRKAIKAVNAGKSADVAFISTNISEAEQAAIHARLADAVDVDGVRAAFESKADGKRMPAGAIIKFTPEPAAYDPITPLIRELRMARIALEAEPVMVMGYADDMKAVDDSTTIAASLRGKMTAIFGVQPLSMARSSNAA